MKFSNSLLWLGIIVFWFKLYRNLYLNLSNWQKVSIGSVNGLVQNRQQAITWTSDDPFHWWIFVSPSLVLTHWGRVTPICIYKLTIIGSGDGLSPGRHQANIWTNAEILVIGPSGTNFSEILIEIHTFSLTKMHLEMSSGEWRPFCLGLNVLMKSSLIYVKEKYMYVSLQNNSAC